MEVIKSSKEISSIFENGKKFSNKYISFIVCEAHKQKSDNSSEHGHNGRVAFIAGKRNGNSVWRNSAKRRMREIYRECGSGWIKYDVLFIAHKNICNVEYSKVLDSVKATLAKMHARSEK